MVLCLSSGLMPMKRPTLQIYTSLVKFSILNKDLGFHARLKLMAWNAPSMPCQNWTRSRHVALYQKRNRTNWQPTCSQSLKNWERRDLLPLQGGSASQSPVSTASKCPFLMVSTSSSKSSMTALCLLCQPTSLVAHSNACLVPTRACSSFSFSSKKSRDHAGSPSRTPRKWRISRRLGANKRSASIAPNSSMPQLTISTSQAHLLYHLHSQPKLQDPNTTQMKSPWYHAWFRTN